MNICDIVQKIQQQEEDDNELMLSDLSAEELLELQTLADKITETVLVVFLAREFMFQEAGTNVRI